MKFNIKSLVQYLLAAGIAMSMQGCISHNVEVANLENINDYRQVMIANQDFKCQNAFVGGAHKFLVKKNDIFKASKLPPAMEVSSFGELSGGVVDKRAIFLKFKEVQSRDFGFLVFPNGKFVYDRGIEQMGVVSPFGASDEFMFNIKCEWKGDTPFEPLTYEKFESLKNAS